MLYKLSWEAIRELASESYKSKDEATVSFYCDGENLDHDQLAQKVKSQIQSSFKEKTELKAFDEHKTEVLDKCLKEIANIGDIIEGTAIFFKINKNGIDERSIKVFSLSRVPRTEVSVDGIFDLEQLIYQYERDSTSLVINLNQQTASLLKLEENKIDQIKTIENTNLPEKDYDYIFKNSPGQENAGFSGTGGEKVKRQIEQAEEVFLNEVAKIIESFLAENREIRYIAVGYSASYRSLIGSFLEKLKRIIESKAVLIDFEKSFSDNQELKNYVLKLIGKEISRSIKNDYQKAKDKYDNFRVGADDVAEAVRLMRVETLFIKENTKVSGFVDENGLIYVEMDSNNFQSIKNVIPRLIQRVINSSGKIKLYRNLRLPDLAARLRY